MGEQTQALVSAEWLSANLARPHLRVVDASWHRPTTKRDGKKEFAESHIPGASFFDIDECLDKSSEFEHMLPSETFFAEYVGNLGIGNDSHVVVYDASDVGMYTCTRVWWMFRFFGHPRVSVLNGGFKNWVKGGHPVTGTYTRPEPARFIATRKHLSWVKTFEDITKNLSTQEFQLVDARSYGRFWGSEPEMKEGILPGHIPHSTCMPFFELLDADGLMLSTEQLKSLFEKFQVDLKKPVCGTCGSALTVCHLVLAAHLCGAPDMPVYDGSWVEWFIRAPPEHVIADATKVL
ncbi:uncharacterized protein V6R79_018197 [Siganus canaliculatus]